LDQLRRTTHLIATTLEGCKFLSVNGSAVTDAIRACRVYSHPTQQEVLCFINALTQRIENQGLDPGQPLYDAGIYYAVKSACPWALKRYLERMVANNYSVVPSKHRKNALSLAVKHPVSVLQEDRPFRMTNLFRSSMLSFLTGWEIDGVPSHGESRKPCFASLICGSSDMYYRYITGIGRLGAGEALWHEWTNPELTPIPASCEQEGFGNNRPDIFIIAFLLADDFARATQIAESIKHLGPKRPRARRRILRHYGFHTDEKIYSTQFKKLLSDLAKL
jgi:hypothetical protein